MYLDNQTQLTIPITDRTVKLILQPGSDSFTWDYSDTEVSWATMNNDSGHWHKALESFLCSHRNQQTNTPAQLQVFTYSQNSKIDKIAACVKRTSRLSMVSVSPNPEEHLQIRASGPGLLKSGETDFSLGFDHLIPSIDFLAFGICSFSFHR